MRESPRRTHIDRRAMPSSAGTTLTSRRTRGRRTRHRLPPALHRPRRWIGSPHVRTYWFSHAYWCRPSGECCGRCDLGSRSGIARHGVFDVAGLDRRLGGGDRGRDCGCSRRTMEFRSAHPWTRIAAGKCRLLCPGHDPAGRAGLRWRGLSIPILSGRFGQASTAAGDHRADHCAFGCASRASHLRDDEVDSTRGERTDCWSTCGRMRR